MKKFLTICALLAISTSAIADTMTCKIRPLRASTIGLMPDDNSKIITLTATVVPFSKTNSTDILKYCRSTQLENRKVELCVLEAAYVGVYNVDIATTEQGQDFPTSSTYSLGMLRSGKGLAFITGKDGIMSSVQEKMSDAKIKMPDALEGDSLQIDEAIEKGVKKGVIKEGDLMSLSLDLEGSCTLN